MKITIIGGCGHVGLPLGAVLAEKGFEVSAFDINLESVTAVNNGKIPFVEHGLERQLRVAIDMGKFRATSDASSISNADIVFVVIGTPIDEHYNPDPSAVPNAIEALRQYFSDNQLVIMRSTVFPGVTQRVEEKFRSINPTINVVFCPERLAEGFAIQELQSLPQLIGVRDIESFKKAEGVFASLGIESIMLSPEEAELGKLFTNVWRYIRFAIANQFYMLAQSSNIDYEKVRRALIYNYPRASDMPKAGFTAGPCLLKDTLALVSFSGNEFPLGQAAVSVNEGLPLFIVNHLKRDYDLAALKVGILGMTFKADLDDIRSSLSFKLRKTLLFYCKEVLWHDPYWQDANSSNLESVLQESDIIILATPHSTYRNIHTQKKVIDIWKLISNDV